MRDTLAKLRSDMDAEKADTEDRLEAVGNTLQDHLTRIEELERWRREVGNLVQDRPRKRSKKRQ